MSVTYQIQVSLPVFKLLTARIEEGQTHDDVIRDLLGVDSIIEPENPSQVPLIPLNEQIKRSRVGSAGGFFSRDLWLPNGTDLRARYKQQQYHAGIAEGLWLAEDGKQHSSPSAAATAITGTNVNGLRFWEAKRPTDGGWRRLELLLEK